MTAIKLGGIFAFPLVGMFALGLLADPIPGTFSAPTSAASTAPSDLAPPTASTSPAEPTTTAATQTAEAPHPPTIVSSDFICEKSPTAAVHASTIVEIKDGLLAAWFGGTTEGARDVGIWTARRDAEKWSDPIEIATGKQDDGKRFACWNPVLCRPREGTVLLFYKVGPNPTRWWAMMMSSNDDGKTWSKARRLPEGILGPIKNKPIVLADGTILCPSSTEFSGWHVHVERTSDLGATWTKSPSINEKGTELIQPTLLDQGEGQLEMLCRSRQHFIYESRSTDNGKTWSEPIATQLPNPDSGIDAIKLKDGRSLLIYNHSDKNRTPLNIALSPDGKSWNEPLSLEDESGEFSYPAAIQTADGLVHVTYTWKREKIKHVVLNPNGSPQ